MSATVPIVKAEILAAYGSRGAAGADIEVSEDAILRATLVEAVVNGLIDVTPQGQVLIDDAFGILLAKLGLPDSGFDDLSAFEKAVALKPDSLASPRAPGLPKSSSGLKPPASTSTRSTLGSAVRVEVGEPAEFAPTVLPGHDDDRTASGRSWRNFTLSVADDVSTRWFSEDYTSILTSDYFSKTVAEVDEGLREVTSTDSPFSGVGANKEEFANSRVFPEFDAKPEMWGERVPIDHSVLGKAIMSELNAWGINGSFSNRQYHGRGDLFTDGGEGAPRLQWAGYWGTSFGTPTSQYFEIYRSAEGDERAFWFINALVETRRSNNFAEIMQRTAMAMAAKKLFWIAEDPFPSSVLFTVSSRGAVFHGAQPAARPKPVVWACEQSLANGAALQGGAEKVLTRIHPKVVRLGYSFDARSMGHLQNFLTVVCDGLVHIASIIEEGFLNFRGADYAAPFDDVFFSPHILNPDSDLPDSVTRGMPRWVPETQIGPLQRDSTASYDTAMSGECSNASEVLEWVADDGAGDAVASAINSLAFSYLLPEGKFDRAERYLQDAIDLDVWNESTNAMANLGNCHIMSGDSESGRALLLSALDRADKFAEGEASYLLGKLALSEGDLEDARRYFERALRTHPEDWWHQPAREGLQVLPGAALGESQSSRMRSRRS
jgi:hypothetical protein